MTGPSAPGELMPANELSRRDGPAAVAVKASQHDG